MKTILNENFISVITELLKHKEFNNKDIEFDYNETDRNSLEHEEHLFNQKFLKRVSDISEDINEFYVTFKFDNYVSLTFQMAVYKNPMKNLRICIINDISSWDDNSWHGDIMSFDYHQELPYNMIYDKINDYLNIINRLKNLIDSVNIVDEYRLNPYSEYKEPKTIFQVED